MSGVVAWALARVEMPAASMALVATTDMKGIVLGNIAATPRMAHLRRQWAHRFCFSLV